MDKIVMVPGFGIAAKVDAKGSIEVAPVFADGEIDFDNFGPIDMENADNAEETLAACKRALGLV